MPQTGAQRSPSRSLARFAIEGSDDDYRLLIEDDAGQRIELAATAEQLELIVDVLDETLESDDALEDEDDDED